MKRLLSAFSLFMLLVSGAAQAQDEPLKIVASFSILADVVQNVAGEKAEVTSLIPPGTDPHAFQPTPQEIAQLAEADVVFINGVNFEEGLIEVIENAGEEVNIVVVSQCVKILSDEVSGEAEDSNEIETLCNSHHAQIVGEPLQDNLLYTMKCEHHEDEHGSCDPHVWTNPKNVMLWTFFIRDSLIQLDPANTDLYFMNAAAYIEQLQTLMQEIEPQLAAIPEENRVLVTNHETLGYLAAAYDFEIVGAVIPGSSTLAEAGAGDIARLIDLIEENEIQAIFAENTVNADLAQQVADETGIQFYTLYSDSLSQADGPASTYLDYLRYNVQTIVSALSE
ncbi:MAG: zinc ABC transporter substrate-binding protein [Anaerolineae bacterium]|nr:zinc ABC transporter substrate-binding protein [Anaerolineae bacterium]